MRVERVVRKSSRWSLGRDLAGLVLAMDPDVRANSSVEVSKRPNR